MYVMKRVLLAISVIVAAGAASINALASSQILQRPPLYAEASSAKSKTSSLFWHETTFNGNSFCDQSYIDNVMSSGGFIEGIFFWIYPAIFNGREYDQKYRYMAPGMTVYDPIGVCSNDEGTEEDVDGYLYFGATPKNGIFDGIDDNGSIVSMEYPAISSSGERGPYVEANISLYHFNQWAHQLGSSSLATFVFALYYVDLEGKWQLSEKTYIENYSGAEDFSISAQLPYSTVAQLRLETLYRDPRAPVWPAPRAAVFPSVFSVSLWTETCVPDLISGQCL